MAFDLPEHVLWVTYDKVHSTCLAFLVSHKTYAIAIHSGLQYLQPLLSLINAPSMFARSPGVLPTVLVTAVLASGLLCDKGTAADGASVLLGAVLHKRR